MCKWSDVTCHQRKCTYVQQGWKASSYRNVNPSLSSILFHAQQDSYLHITNNVKCGWGCGNSGHLSPAHKSTRWTAQHFGRRAIVFKLRWLSIMLHMTWWLCSQEKKYTGSHKIITHMSCGINHNSEWKDPNVYQVMCGFIKTLYAHRLGYGIWHELFTDPRYNVSEYRQRYSDDKEARPNSNDAVRIKYSQHRRAG